MIRALLQRLRAPLIVDAAGCVCVMCVVGDSVPAQRLTEAQKDRVWREQNITDRTGYTNRDWERWLQ